MQSNRRSRHIQIESGAGKRSLISLTPLIDVVFILLVFYMLAAAAPRWESIHLEPPVQGQSRAPGPPAIIVNLAAEGGVTLDGEAVPLDALIGGIASMPEKDPTRPVAVQPSRGVTLQRVVTVLERLSVLPVSSVSLMRERAPEK